MNLENVVSKEEIGNLLKTLIRIKSVGNNETLCAEKIIDYLERENIFTYDLIESSVGRGNLIVDIGNGKKTLIILGHLDTVPAGNGWKVDPFSGTEKNGYIFGRGAVDNKGQAAVMTFLAILLKRLNISFNGKIRLIFAADEELQDPDHGLRYLVKKHTNLFRNVFGAIGELGGLIYFKGSKKQLLIFGEKGSLISEISFRNRSAHSSIHDNCDFIKYVFNKLEKIPSVWNSEYVPDYLIDVMTRQMHIPRFFIANAFLRSVLLSVLQKIRPNIASDLKNLMCTVVTPTLIQIGDSENMTPSSARIKLNVRFHNNSHPLRVITKIRTFLGMRYNPYVRIIKITPATYSPPNTLLFDRIKETIMSFGYEPLPIIMPATSDSAWLRLIGIPTYHFFLTKNVIVNCAHKPNERIGLSDLMLALEGYFSLVQNIFKFKEKVKLSEEIRA
ncbi:MAG: M20 family metallopeptidase [Candidatus Njordarchaeia archaeon]|nr:M20/M25/M40 family metallo-hydrolase [Candidatus Korarchaeota archaeon]